MNLIAACNGDKQKDEKHHYMKWINSGKTLNQITTPRELAIFYGPFINMKNNEARKYEEKIDSASTIVDETPKPIILVRYSRTEVKQKHPKCSKEPE